MFRKIWVLFMISLVNLSIASTDLTSFLTNAKYPVMNTYKAEAFLSYDIYSESEKEKGKKLYYTPTEYAILLDYKHADSGFNGGLYKLSNGKYIIAFGGTTASSLDDSTRLQILDKVEDVITDLNLLNGRVLSSQPKDALDYTKDLIKDYGLNKNNIILTGHSLGGGLVQYVSFLTKIKGVTFNTAPFPIPYLSIDINIFGVDINVVNIMSSRDQLTGTLMYIENYENQNCSIERKYHYGEMITEVSNILQDGFYKYIPKSQPLLQQTYKQYNPEDRIIKLAEMMLGKFSTKTSSEVINESILLFLNKIFISFPIRDNPNSEYNKAKDNYAMAISKLTMEDFPGFIKYLKLAFLIDDMRLKKLFLGQRVIIDTNTEHSMKDLIVNSYDYDNTKYRKDWLILKNKIDKLKKLHYSFSVTDKVNKRFPLEKASQYHLISSIRKLYNSYTTEDKYDGIYIDSKTQKISSSNFKFIQALNLEDKIDIAKTFADFYDENYHFYDDYISYKEYMLIVQATYRKIFGDFFFRYINSLNRNLNNTYVFYDKAYVSFADSSMHSIYRDIFILHYSNGIPKQYLQNDGQDITNAFAINFFNQFYENMVKYQDKIKKR